MDSRSKVEPLFGLKTTPSRAPTFARELGQGAITRVLFPTFRGREYGRDSSNGWTDREPVLTRNLPPLVETDQEPGVNEWSVTSLFYVSTLTLEIV